MLVLVLFSEVHATVIVRSQPHAGPASLSKDGERLSAIFFGTSIKVRAVSSTLIPAADVDYLRNFARVVK